MSKQEKQKVGFFERGEQVKPSRLIDRWEIYGQIRDGTYAEDIRRTIELFKTGIESNWKEQDKSGYMKYRRLHLQQVLFHGTFSRAQDTIIRPEELTGLINLDLDENSKEELDNFANYLHQIPSIEACGLSVSGEFTGARWANLRIEIPSDYKDLPDKIKESVNEKIWLHSLYHLYHEALSALLNDYGIAVGDAKDIKRLRYLPHDPNLYINEDAGTYSLQQLTAYLETISPEEQKKHTQTYDGDKTPEAIMDWVTQRHGQPVEGNRHSKLVSYFFTCLHHGVEKEKAFQHASNYGGDYKKIGENIYSRYQEQSGVATNSNLFGFNDVDNSKRLIDKFGEVIRYAKDLGGWFTWDGTRWQEDKKEEVLEYAKQTAESIHLEANKLTDEKAKERFHKWANTTKNRARLKNMIELSQSAPGIVKGTDEFDRIDEGKFTTWKLNILNGTIDLKTGTLQPHNLEDHITKLAEVEYNKDEACPLWNEFLERIFSDNQELIEFVQKAVGYSLTASTDEQVVFILHGNGANGKTTFIELIKSILGDYSIHMPMESLLSKSNSGDNTNDIARLNGSRFVVASEGDEGRHLSEAKVKQLTGGDTLTARFLFREYFDFTPTHKIFMVTNHKPVIKGNDEAIWRRIRLIPFQVTIPPEERDRDLLKKLQKELPGILNWAVEGCLKWQEEGLDEPLIVKEATEEYKDEMDIIGKFLDDCIIFDKEEKISSSKLFDIYKKWAEKNGERSLSQTAFSNKLREKGVEKTRKAHGMVWIGVKINELSSAANTEKVVNDIN